jgi:hypothetical protein
MTRNKVKAMEGREKRGRIIDPIIGLEHQGLGALFLG